jgi:hypothetical protein
VPKARDANIRFIDRCPLYPPKADIVSEIVATTAGVEMSGFPLREVTVRGRAEPLAVRIVGAMNELVA